MTCNKTTCGCTAAQSQDRLLTQQEAAKILSISPLTLEYWRWKGGKGPKFIKVGKLARYRESDIYAYIDGLEVNNQ